MSDRENDTYPSNIKKYQKQMIIGQGAFGSVWDAKINIGPHMGEYVAIKEVDLEELGDKLVENLSNEISLMSSLNHPNLIKTLQTCTLGHKIYIIMPLMDAGSLNSIINFKYPQGIKDECIIATILRICLETLDYLHERNYMHRDIKSGNILVNKEGLVTLGDFGVATRIKKECKKKSFVGSFCWMPPEVISNEGYDTKFDIWSLGITAIEMAQGKPPFFNLGELDVIRKVQFDEPPALKEPQKWDPLFINFIKSCLVKNPLLRPTAKQVLEMNAKFFLKAKNKEYLAQTLLKGVPSVKERYGKMNFYVENSCNSFESDQFKDHFQIPMKHKINWNFSSLLNINKHEECEVDDESDENTINISHLGENGKTSSNFDYNSVALKKMTSNTTSFLEEKSTTSFKCKMNPEIEETLKKNTVDLNGNGHGKSCFKKFENIKKCFDGDDDQ